jgi:hypothetical protein
VVPRRRDVYLIVAVGREGRVILHGKARARLSLEGEEMLFDPPYNALFEVDEAIPPGTVTHLDQWFGPGTKLSLERLLVLFALNRYISEGLFDEPGMYLFHMHRRRGWRLRGHLYKFPPGANLGKITEFLMVIGINLGEDDDPPVFNPRNN